LSISNNFNTVWTVSVALLKGMGVTLRYMFQPKVTIQYPKEKAPIPDRFRGMLTFHIDECIACDLCVRACPSACIALEAVRNEAGKKIIQNYTIDFGKCNWCRLCEEACPTNPKSVHHTNEYELLFMSRDDFRITWLTAAKGVPHDEESLRIITEAVDFGCNFFDTADVYGHGHSEELLGRALKGRRQDVILATKGGSDFYHEPARLNFTESHLVFAVEESLK